MIFFSLLFLLIVNRGRDWIYDKTWGTFDMMSPAKCNGWAKSFTKSWEHLTQFSILPKLSIPFHLLTGFPNIG